MPRNIDNAGRWFCWNTFRIIRAPKSTRLKFLKKSIIRIKFYLTEAFTQCFSSHSRTWIRSGPDFTASGGLYLGFITLFCPVQKCPSSINPFSCVNSLSESSPATSSSSSELDVELMSRVKVFWTFGYTFKGKCWLLVSPHNLKIHSWYCRKYFQWTNL